MLWNDKFHGIYAKNTRFLMLYYCFIILRILSIVGVAVESLLNKKSSYKIVHFELPLLVFQVPLFACAPPVLRVFLRLCIVIVECTENFTKHTLFFASDNGMVSNYIPAITLYQMMLIF